MQKKPLNRIQYPFMIKKKKKLNKLGPESHYLSVIIDHVCKAHR